MFPVPSHLPKTGEEPTTSPENDEIDSKVEVDTVLELFEPLFRGGELDSKTVRGVRESVQAAIVRNKTTSHDILKANYPSISSHIRNGSQITSDFKSIQLSLTELEKKLDPTNTETSFIPPLISLLRRHFTAVQAQSQASARSTALKDLKRSTERLKRLEESVYGARGADEGVVEELQGVTFGDGALGNSEVMKTIKSRTDLLKALLVEQVVGGFKQAISIEEGGQPRLVVQNAVKLERPRNIRPGFAADKVEAPTYSLEQIYIALSRLQALEEPLRTLQNRILKDVIGSILSGTHSVAEDSDGTKSTLRLTSLSQRSSDDILSDLSTLFTFIQSTVFPPIQAISDDRTRFLAALHAATSELLLSTLIVPSIPASLDDLPIWLNTIQTAASFESTANNGMKSTTPVKSFYENQAGQSWANQRRSQVGEQVRELIVDGWAGWEAVSISRDKEISVVVEVEVDEEEDIDMDTQVETAEPKSTLESGTSSVPAPAEKSAKTDNEEEEGWEFEEPVTLAQPEAGPSSPRRIATEDADDGWAFDDDLSTPAPAPAPVKVPKPTREAKKLGKKVAKAKTQEQEDQDSGIDSAEASRSNSIATPTPPRAPTPESKAGGMDWAWDDEPKKEVAKPKAKRKVLKDEKRVIKETFLVSKACDTLLDLAEHVLRDARAISDSPPAPSFTLAPGLLQTTTTEIFDLYRSLIRSHFDAQLQSVPTLSMQVYNDSIHLSDRLNELSRQYEAWQSSDVCRRLREFGEGSFERELERQRDSLISTLDTLEWNRGVEGFKRGASVPGRVRGDLEDLSRMFQTVLPTTTYLSVIGYLVNVAISTVTDAILAQQDITEEESNHLNELLRTLHPLEELFVLEAGQPSSVVEHVHGWLKFCYLSELLSANLVDITYLFENGALIDFTPDELISLLKALFADSEKREKAIERIERGLQQ